MTRPEDNPLSGTHPEPEWGPWTDALVYVQAARSTLNILFAPHAHALERNLPPGEDWGTLLERLLLVEDHLEQAEEAAAYFPNSLQRSRLRHLRRGLRALQEDRRSEWVAIWQFLFGFAEQLADLEERLSAFVIPEPDPRRSTRSSW